MRKLLLIALSATILLSACSKKDDPQPDPNNNNNSNNNNSARAAILTKGSWKITSSIRENELSDGGTDTRDVAKFMDDCVIDNLYTLQKAGTVLVDEGATKCDEADAQQRTQGKWTLSDGDKKLKIPAPVWPAASTDINIHEVNAEIVSIDDNRLEITYTLDFFYGLKATYHTVYSR